MITSFQLHSLVQDIITELYKLDENAQGISYLFTGAGREGIAPTAVQTIEKMVKDLTDGDINSQHQLRALNAQVRLSLHGDQRLVANALVALLPKRPDYRGQDRPQVIKPVGSTALGEASDVLEALSKESPEYLHYLIRSAVGSEDYAAKLPMLEYKPLIAELEKRALAWTVTPELVGEDRFLVRILSEVDEHGVPRQMVDSRDTVVQMLRSVLPILHAVSRLARPVNHPYYRFNEQLPNLLTEAVGGNIDVDDTPDILQHLTSVLLFNQKQNRLAEEASDLVTRLHHGHPEYSLLFRLFQNQHNLLLNDFADTVTGLAALIRQYGGDLVFRSANWTRFLTETNIAAAYQTDRQNALRQG